MQDLSGFITQNGLKYEVEVQSVGLILALSILNCNHHYTNRLNILIVLLYSNLLGMGETFHPSLLLNEEF